MDVARHDADRVRVSRRALRCRDVRMDVARHDADRVSREALEVSS
jgi:hypothetical protein